MLPFPSSFVLVEDDTPSGYRVDFGPTTLPVNIDGVQSTTPFSFLLARSADFSSLLPGA